MEKSLEFEINLDENKENSLNKISSIIEEQRKNLDKEKNLKFTVIQNGQKIKEFTYTLKKEKIEEYEKEYFLPKVISSVIKKELGSKISENQDIINNIVNNLKDDPYWSERVVKLIKSLNEEK